MARDVLTLPPHLTPWHMAGVDYVLADHDLPPELSLCSEGQKPPAAAAPPAGRAQPQHAAPAHQQRRPAPQRPAAQTAEARPAPAAASPKTADALPPQQWPAPWQERLHATRPGHVLWTYWALGEDLCGTPNPARRDMLRRLLADLAHPAGTHCFWPVALPGEDGLMPNGEVFWAAAGLLKARAIVVMGSPAVKVLGLPAGLRPFQQTRHRGKLIVVLRDMDALAEEQQHYESVRAFLKEALAPFATLRQGPSE